MTFRLFKAFAATFAYLAEHWLLLLKAMWLPALLIAGLQLYAAPQLLAAMAEFALLGPNPDPAEAAAALSRLGAAALFYAIAGLIFFPMLTVASLKHIILGEEPRLPFHFAYGADETRLMAANFLFNLMIVVIALVADLAIGVLAAVTGLLGPAAATAIKGAGSLLTQVATGWFQARLSTLFPAVMATRSLALGVAWNATRTQWLGLIGYWILIGLVLMPIVILLLLPIALPFAADFAAVQGGDAAAVSAFFQKLSGALAPSAPGFLIAAAAVFAMTIVVNAIVNIASAVAWRYLEGEQDSDGNAP